MHDSVDVVAESPKPLLSDERSRETQDYGPQNIDPLAPFGSGKDIEMPMPPLLLAPSQLDIVG